MNGFSDKQVDRIFVGSCLMRLYFSFDNVIRKPHNSNVHFPVTTEEPHGVCCLEGLKVSLGMHNFGETRWGKGIIDDIRSLNDRNTRIIGDFTKMVRTAPIVELMIEIMITDMNWSLHFNDLVEKSDYPELNIIDPVVPKIVSACEWLAENARRFRRSTLQTRFFEVGDNFYLGMEFPREYNQWKTNLVEQLVSSLGTKRRLSNKGITCDKLKHTLAHNIDKLWYYACLETIRTGDVYNPGAQYRVPRLYLINSIIPQKLGTLSIGESFRLVDSPQEKYEVLIKQAFSTTVRNVEGYITRMHNNTFVKRESNLTRTPDGNEESKVVRIARRSIHGRLSPFSNVHFDVITTNIAGYYDISCTSLCESSDNAYFGSRERICVCICRGRTSFGKWILNS